MSTGRKRRLILFLAASDCLAANPITREVKRYLSDGKDLAVAPLHWKREQWIRFGEGTAAVAALYAADRHLDDAVQRNRGSFSDDFAKTITPFGGHRAIEMSVLLIAGGALSRDTRVRDAGCDSLEAELWAAGVVTPLLKRVFGRARPNQNQGAHSFDPRAGGRDAHESFPSGHATNAFAFATAVASHYDHWIVPTIVYTMATGVSISRVNDRAHFPSDVLAGALIGRAVAKSIVARHRDGKVAWTVTPIVLPHGLGALVSWNPGSEVGVHPLFRGE
jgi:membrane-associated phospholipid phosphatase